MSDTNWPVDKSRMERGLYWQEAWKLVEGCTPVSSGCDHCWSAAETKMRSAHPNEKISVPKQGLLQGGCFNGKIRLREDNLDKPLRAKKPRVYAVWNDLFHEDVPDEFRDKVFAVAMATSGLYSNNYPSHKYLILTKRPEIMKNYWRNGAYDRIALVMADDYKVLMDYTSLPSPNVHLGISVEDQKTADERIPLLLQTPAAKRFVSYEPALGPVDFEHIQWPMKHKVDVLRGGAWDAPTCLPGFTNHSDMNTLDQIIMGGESGPKARPMHPEWARKVRDQCKAAGVPFFFKQWGEWVPHSCASKAVIDKIKLHYPVPIRGFKTESIEYPDGRGESTYRVGKKAAGALLDGQEHKEVLG